MAAVIKRCSAYGLATAGSGAVVMAGAGAVTIPLVGSVPGWVAGFLAGFVGGTVLCTMVQRGVVIEALKKAASAHYGRSMSSDDAIAALRTELFRARAHGLRS